MIYLALELGKEIHLYPAPTLDKHTGGELIAYAETLNEEWMFVAQTTEHEQLEFLCTLADAWTWLNWEEFAEGLTTPLQDDRREVHFHKTGPLG